MKKVLIVIIVFFSFAIKSQNPLFFHTKYGSEADETGNSVIQALNGQYLIIGQTTGFGASQNDILLTRTNNLGIPIWHKLFGGFNADVGKALVELSDSSIVFVGYSNSFGNGGYDAVIFKTDKNGNLIWKKTYGGTDWDFANSINKTSDGNLIVCGTTFSFGRGAKDAFILKIDPNGNFLWNKVYGGKKDDELKEIIQSKDGGYIAVGTTKSYGDSLGNVWVTKFNSSGDSTWFIQRGGAKMEVGNSIVQDKNDNYLICGGSESYTFGKEDAYIVKLANNGSFIWDNHFGLSTQDEEAYDILNTTSNFGTMVITLGWRVSGSTELDVYTIVLSNEGFYINGGTFGGLKDEVAHSICNTKDKGYVAVGYTEGFNALLKDVFIVKYDSELTIGPLIISVEELTAQNEKNAYDIYPTLISESVIYVKPGQSNSGKPISIQIYDIMGALIENVRIEKSNQGFYKLTIPEHIKGLLLINLNNGELVKKCIAN